MTLETAVKREVNNSRGFTLIEILVVLALTLIVMGLIFYPLTESFKITKRAEVSIRAQDDARFAMRQISRDLSSAMLVHDQTPIKCPVLDANGNRVVVDLSDAKIDIVLPRMRGYCPNDSAHTPAGVQRGYDARHIDASPVCPVCGEPLTLAPVEPLVPDNSLIVRYFVGLKHNEDVDLVAPASSPNWYINGFERKLVEAGEDNTYVLYRAVFDPTDTTLFPTNNKLENLNDPGFFYNQNNNGAGSTYAEEWARVSRPVVTVTDVDLIRIRYDETTGAPFVTSTVRFTPTKIYNDHLTPTTQQTDLPEHSGSLPTMYKATYGNWMLPYEVVLERRMPNGSLARYITLDRGAPGLSIYNEANLANPVFRIAHYHNTVDSFGSGNIDPPRPELAFTVDYLKGQVNFAFPHIDRDLSNSLRMPASLHILSHDVNEFFNRVCNAYAYQPSPDRFRRWEFHHPASRTLPYLDTVIPERRVLGNSTVIAGMEKVIGPRQVESGESPGNMILYSRVPFYDVMAEPGLNQYKLDVEHIPCDIDGNPVPGLGGTAALYFSSKVANPLPVGADGNAGIYLLYYEQNNKKGDILRATYTTKNVITVIMGIRIYDPSTGKPQSVQLNSKVHLKNVPT